MNEEIEETIVDGCTCNDEFVTSPCPIHSTIKEAKDSFGISPLIINDELLVSKEQGVFQGFIFLCPVCKKPAIMVNPDMGNLCCNCGQKVTIQSKTVTEFVRKL